MRLKPLTNFKVIHNIINKGKALDENQLFSDVEKLLEISRDFKNRIKFAEEVWSYETEALQLFERQVEICETIRDLVRAGRYGEAFILNRTLLENYLWISLILEGTKYVLRYKVLTEANETPKEAYERIVKKLEGREDIVSYRPLKNYREMEVIHKGLYNKEKNKLIPIYYFVFQEYDPVTHWVGKIESIASKDFLQDFYTKWQKEHESLYKTYFGFRNLLRAAILNGIITNEQADRVRVHYNFLSAFTHLTKMGFALLNPNRGNKHYLLELNLLYVLSLLRLYLLLMIKFFSKTKHSINDIAQLMDFLKEQRERYDYFWFIFNDPSEYDYFEYQTVKAYRKMIKGEEMEDKIPYYKNPYERLERQHQNIVGFSTGLTYKSPWPKHDVS